MHSYACDDAKYCTQTMESGQAVTYTVKAVNVWSLPQNKLPAPL